MGTAKHIGRVGALAVTLRIGNFRRSLRAWRCRSASPCWWCWPRRAGADGVAGRAVVGDRVEAGYDRVDPGRDRHPDAQRLLRRSCQEPIHRTDSSGPVHRVRQGDHAHGVLAPLGAVPPLRDRGDGVDTQHGSPELLAAFSRISRGGNSRGSSTSPSISRCGPGSPIWRRRWPSTATTIWSSTATRKARPSRTWRSERLAEQHPAGTKSPRYQLRVGR